METVRKEEVGSEKLGKPPLWATYFFFLAFNAASFSMYLAFSVRRFASARSSLGVLFVEPGGRPNAVSNLRRYDTFIVSSSEFTMAKVLLIRLDTWRTF